MDHKKYPGTSSANFQDHYYFIDICEKFPVN